MIGRKLETKRRSGGLFSYDAEMVCANFFNAGRSFAGENRQVIAAGKKRCGQDNFHSFEMAASKRLQIVPAPDGLAFCCLQLDLIAAVASIFYS